MADILADIVQYRPGRLLADKVAYFQADTNKAARADGFKVAPQARGFVFNADLTAVIRFLNIGTQTSQKVR